VYSSLAKLGHSVSLLHGRLSQVNVCKYVCVRVYAGVCA
jgi:hypothetical protein